MSNKDTTALNTEDHCYEHVADKFQPTEKIITGFVIAVATVN